VASRPQLTRGGKRNDGRRRGGVLDVAVQALREAEQLREPVERELLDLRRRRRRAPEHRVDVQGRDDELGEDPRLEPVLAK
jgi:hypothetical protein